jgi:hypothetical protein
VNPSFDPVLLDYNAGTRRNMMTPMQAHFLSHTDSLRGVTFYKIAKQNLNINKATGGVFTFPLRDIEASLEQE